MGIDTRPFDGIPFEYKGRDYTGADCWGLVWLVSRDAFGIELPAYVAEGVTTEGELDPRAIARRLEAELARYERVDDPAPGDIVLLKTKQRPLHFGIVVNKRPLKALHTEAGIGPMIERLNGLLWRNRIDGFYRFKA